MTAPAEIPSILLSMKLIGCHSSTGRSTLDRHVDDAAHILEQIDVARVPTLASTSRVITSTT